MELCVDVIKRQGMAEGMPLERSVRFAAGAGALACTRFGAQPSMPWRHEVEAMLETEKEEEGMGQ